MKRRLRKKLFLGEFQEYYLRVEIRVNTSQMDDDAFIDRWIDEIEANDMMCGGGCGEESGAWDFVVSCGVDLEVSREKRKRIETWLQAEPSVKKFTLSPVYADLTLAFDSSPAAATRQRKANSQRGINSVIWNN